jgi:hypothetical protein
VANYRIKNVTISLAERCVVDVVAAIALRLMEPELVIFVLVTATHVAKKIDLGGFVHRDAEHRRLSLPNILF